WTSNATTSVMEVGMTPPSSKLRSPPAKTSTGPAGCRGYPTTRLIWFPVRRETRQQQERRPIRVILHGAGAA
ncbi:MAG: hypothetical protein AVDCRST_MAG93-5192, partial [uncultured Chloroflexia bacterium]